LLFANHKIPIFLLTKANKMRYNLAKMGRVPKIFAIEAADSQQVTLIWAFTPGCARNPPLTALRASACGGRNDDDLSRGRFCAAQLKRCDPLPT